MSREWLLWRREHLRMVIQDMVAHPNDPIVRGYLRDYPDALERKRKELREVEHALDC